MSKVVLLVVGGDATVASLEGQFECPFSVASTGPRSYFHSFLLVGFVSCADKWLDIFKNVLSCTTTTL